MARITLRFYHRKAWTADLIVEGERLSKESRRAVQQIERLLPHAYDFTEDGKKNLRSLIKEYHGASTKSWTDSFELVPRRREKPPKRDRPRDQVPHDLADRYLKCAEERKKYEQDATRFKNEAERHEKLAKLAREEAQHFKSRYEKEASEVRRLQIERDRYKKTVEAQRKKIEKIDQRQRGKTAASKRKDEGLF